MDLSFQNKDYRYSLEIYNEKWDVYYFIKNGKKGTLAFTKRGEKFVIGLMQKGNLSESQATDVLKLNYE